MRDNPNFNQDIIDNLMSDWLIRLGKLHKAIRLPGTERKDKY
jgi:hypothetical protein